MPVPEHLRPYLDVLGTGGTVALAEQLHAITERAIDAAIPPDVAILVADRDRLRDELDSACHLVARMHAAAVGEVRGPIRSVVEDVEDLRAEVERLKAQGSDGTTSDGFHTFDELYAHRTALFAALTRTHPQHAWRSRNHHEGGDAMFPGYFIAGMMLPAGQVSYHVRAEAWDLFDGVPELDRAPLWDGHTPGDVIERINGWQADPISRAIEASSLGAPEAVAARASVPIEQAQAVVRRATDLAASACADGHLPSGYVEDDPATVDGVVGTVVECPRCHAGLVHDTDILQPGPAPTGYPEVVDEEDDDIDWDDDEPVAVSTGDLLLAREAAASVALDHDPQAETIALPNDEDRPSCNCTPYPDGTHNRSCAHVIVRGKPGPASAASARPEPTNAEIRAWCAANGVSCNASGAIRRSARDAYNTAHREG